jgi:dTDP-glucose 4,6-dehydratase
VPGAALASLTRVKVLVTGGAGFIGSHYARRLAALGDEVVVLDKLTYSGNRANLEDVEHEFHQGDIAVREDVNKAAKGCNAIVNFAAETHVDRSILGATDFGHTEFTGTQVLLEYVKEHEMRYVQVSTDEVYGDMPEGQSAIETDAVRPSSPYSVAKAAGDMWIPAYVRTFGINASITRGANTYGSHQYPEKMIPLFTTNALDGQPLPLYGDGRQRREWLHVADHCSGIDLVLREGEPGEIYNVGGQERENMDVVRRILDLTGASPDLVRLVDDRPGHDRRYSVDATKLRGLGWTPRHSFETGLAETVEWYRAHRDWWEPIKSGDFRAYYERQYAARLS